MILTKDFRIKICKEDLDIKYIDICRYSGSCPPQLDHNQSMPTKPNIRPRLSRVPYMDNNNFIPIISPEDSQSQELCVNQQVTYQSRGTANQSHHFSLNLIYTPIILFKK